MIVIKRDNTTQDFDEDKIAKVVMAAGLDQNQAIELAQQVAQGLGDKSHITSLEIRDEVSTKLHSMDEYAANMFDWYQKQKEEGKV